MKILFISIHQQDIGECKRAPTDISGTGARYLSSYLKDKGHKTNILFLAKSYAREENEKELKQINDLISKLKPDLIGFSFMSVHFFRAKKITKAIKREFNIPIIWGGIHSTIKPADCLDYADIVCVGEGELALEQLVDSRLVKKNNDLDIQGLWYKKNGQVIDKGAAPLLENIDNLPYPDYDLEDHYIIHEHRLVPLTEEILVQYYPASKGDHRLTASRGCPHACAYCCNSAYRIMYKGAHFRRRAVEGLIDEMLTIKNQFSFVKSFKIMDDVFTANSANWLRDFGRRYKEKINLPFYCLVSPLTIDGEKLKILVDAGLNIVQMGLQSGSDRISKDIYLRNVTSQRFLEAMQLLESYGDKLKILLDVIVDNPYEKEEDVLDSIKTLNQLKKGFNLGVYSLAFYPGTILYERAVKEKILSDSEEYLSKEFHVFKHNYLNKLIYLIPRLRAERVEKFINKRQNLFVKLYLELLFFIYIRKNKIPVWLLRVLSKLKRIFKKIL